MKEILGSVDGDVNLQFLMYDRYIALTHCSRRPAFLASLTKHINARILGVSVELEDQMLISLDMRAFAPF